MEIQIQTLPAGWGFRSAFNLSLPALLTGSRRSTAALHRGSRSRYARYCDLYTHPAFRRRECRCQGMTTGRGMYRVIARPSTLRHMGRTLNRLWKERWPLGEEEGRLNTCSGTSRIGSAFTRLAVIYQGRPFSPHNCPGPSIAKMHINNAKRSGFSTKAITRRG